MDLPPIFLPCPDVFLKEKRDALKNIKEAVELYLGPDTNELVDFTGEKVTILV